MWRYWVNVIVYGVLGVACTLMWRKCDRQGDAHYSSGFKVGMCISLFGVLWNLAVVLWWMQ